MIYEVVSPEQVRALVKSGTAKLKKGQRFGMVACHPITKKLLAQGAICMPGTENKPSAKPAASTDKAK